LRLDPGRFAILDAAAGSAASDDAADHDDGPADAYDDEEHAAQPALADSS
jgi:hypothetical protein